MPRSCFVISPIGEEGTKTRRQADCVFDYIVKPALDGLDYRLPERVDRSDKPVHITSEIITQLLEADLVVADLSSLNANVFYELGIRHAFKKPCILLSDWIDRPPFDISGVNVIRYVYDDPTSHRAAASRIRSQAETLDGGGAVSNPLTVAFGLRELEKTGDDEGKLIVQLSEQLSRQQAQIDELLGALHLGWRDTSRPRGRGARPRNYLDTGRLSRLSTVDLAEASEINLAEALNNGLAESEIDERTRYMRKLLDQIGRDNDHE